MLRKLFETLRNTHDAPGDETFTTTGPCEFDSARDADSVEAAYTISTASGNDWPVLPGIDYATLLQPRSLACESAEEEGDHSFRTGTALVSVSWELAGTWAVSVEGAASPEAADLIVEEMARQLGEATGETALPHRVAG
ncbi:hypothetical protein [Streptomyces sp. NPDC094032]|uniref:hypothetical protein n=1 Tax=Streptomyces sp. NPDC094032 TaxID=3155308 RepID=UPI003321F4BA